MNKEKLKKDLKELKSEFLNKDTGFGVSARQITLYGVGILCLSVFLSLMIYGSELTSDPLLFVIILLICVKFSLIDIAPNLKSGFLIAYLFSLGGFLISALFKTMLIFKITSVMGIIIVILASLYLKKENEVKSERTNINRL